jgi:hypothetical protein
MLPLTAMKACCGERKGGKLDAGGLLLSGGLLLLVPKCPVCLAAYVAAFTGLGLSFSAAAGLRWALIMLCVASLGFLTVRLIKRIPTFREK